MGIYAWIELVATILAALGAAFGIVYGALQLGQIKNDKRQSEQDDIDGVAITWRTARLHENEYRPGYSLLDYEVEISNPGKRPIDHISANIVFPVDVIRLKPDGQETGPSKREEYSTPVIAGGKTRPWIRKLIVKTAELYQLENTTGTVTFRDIRQTERTNTWPRKV